jgi:hypothetical protein
MVKINRALSIRLKFLVSCLCALLVVALATLPAQTASALPPRPTPVTPTPISMPASTSPGWAVIELHVQPAAELALWTVVQWQDRLGGWHDVEGWRGTLDEASNGVGKKVWWVARANFDTGPFRWVIYQGPGGKLLATSGSFQLPRYENTMGVIEVSLK